MKKITKRFAKEFNNQTTDLKEIKLIFDCQLTECYSIIHIIRRDKNVSSVRKQGKSLLTALEHALKGKWRNGRLAHKANVITTLQQQRRGALDYLAAVCATAGE